MTIDPQELWDYEHIGAYAKMAPTYVQNRIAVQPDFPPPIRATGPRSHPRWVAAEVMDWFKRQRSAA